LFAQLISTLALVQVIKIAISSLNLGVIIIITKFAAQVIKIAISSFKLGVIIIAKFAIFKVNDS
jgi:hypothetical protein